MLRSSRWSSARRRVASAVPLRRGRPCVAVAFRFARFAFPLARVIAIRRCVSSRSGSRCVAVVRASGGTGTHRL